MKKISKPLVKWYQQNKRELPWRKDKNPYHVWISEIMLQQTKIEAVKKYYNKFMKILPTIEDLANIDEGKLLKLWEGLGYYNRARNLQKAAKIIQTKYQGAFPTDYNDILNLPGIGPYTAGAISSICFNEKQTAVDGNVLRVYMRLTDCNDNILDEKTKKKVSSQLLEILPEESGDFNEGLMELGETICTPTTPNCKVCPLKKFCKALKNNTKEQLPVRIKKDTKKQENLTIFLLCCKNKFAISYRKDHSLLKNLWEFPNIEKELSIQDIKEWLSEKKATGKIYKSITHQHIFTHKIWNMKSYKIYIDHELTEYTWVNIKQAKKEYAIPTAFQPFLKELERIYKNEEESNTSS